MKTYEVNLERVLFPSHPSYRRSEMILNMIAKGGTGLIPYVLQADVIELLNDNIDPLRISRAIQAGLRQSNNVDGKWLEFVDMLIDDPCTVRNISPEDILNFI